MSAIVNPIIASANTYANLNSGTDTHLTGSLIAAGSVDENGVFQDNNNLNLSTKTLTFENLANTNYSSSNSMNVGAVYTDNGVNPKTKKEDNGISSASTSFSTGMNYDRTKTLATLGNGNITIADKANSDDLARLNTDTTQVDKSLFKTNTGTSVSATLDTRLLTADGRAQIKNQNKELAGNVINGVALAGNIITGNMDVDNAIKSFQDPTKMADTLKSNPELAATLDAFSKGQFDNLPKTKEGLQTLADATGLSVNVLLTTVTAYQDAKGTTDKNLVALDVNPDNRADIVGTLGHEESHVRGGTSETLADMSGYSAQLLSEAAIGGYDQQYLNGIKFELGTGKDSATQTANQVLLGSDNQTYLDAYANNPESFQKRVYFIAGAGNDKDGWNYMGRWKNAFAKSGISDFVRVNESMGKNGDVAFTALNKDSQAKNLDSMFAVQSVANDYIKNLKSNPLDNGEQFNLAGYSYGSVMQAQAALNLAQRGIIIDNLVLIGSPISSDSELYKQLSNTPNIKNIIRQDISGDLLSNSRSSIDFTWGGIKAALPILDGDNSHHFDLARPGSKADKDIQNAVTNITNNGVKN